MLACEPDNPYDSDAISVRIEGYRIVYLSRKNAARYQPGLIALQREHGIPIAVAGAIMGGGPRDDGPGRLGVFLNHDPEAFGVEYAG